MEYFSIRSSRSGIASFIISIICLILIIIITVLDVYTLFGGRVQYYSNITNGMFFVILLSSPIGAFLGTLSVFQKSYTKRLSIFGLIVNGLFMVFGLGMIFF
ncbi:MAG: hypothetical protein RO469_04695 [Thermincola sp.]|jgi:small-conductance mechanosensitive channel|nr:hypothetical protein [Thermincola sp.]MDT3703807.1 hypothetical protein [Thermincola sp.]